MNNNFLPYQLKKTNDTNESLATQLAQIVTNVKSFGAKGDGVTDDTTAIQNTINSLTNGGVVFLPYGKTFLISSSLKISGSNIRIFGYGAKLFSNSSINLLDIQPSASHIEVYGLEMYKTTSLTGAMVYVEAGASYVKFESCNLHDNSGDMLYNRGDYLLVKHCIITNGALDSAGVASYGSHGKILYNIISQTRVGVYCHDVTLGVESNVLIQGNTIFNCGSYAKEVDGAIIAYEMYDVTIVDNEIDLTMVANVQINGIRARTGNKILIANNRVRGGANCISVNPFNGSTNYVDIINNKVSQPVTYGILVKGKSYHVNVSNNIIENTPNAGLCIATDATPVPNGLTISTTSGSPTATLSAPTTAIAQGDVLTITGYTGNVVVSSVSGTTVTFTANASTTVTNAAITVITDVPQDVAMTNNILDNTANGAGNQCIYITGANECRIVGNYAKRFTQYENAFYLYANNVANVITNNTIQNNTLYSNGGYALREYNVPTGSGNKFIDNRILAGNTAFNADSGVRTLP